MFDSMIKGAEELLKMLISSIKIIKLKRPVPG
jgi:hypothetical protein